MTYVTPCDALDNHQSTLLLILSKGLHCFCCRTEGRGFFYIKSSRLHYFLSQATQVDPTKLLCFLFQQCANLSLEQDQRTLRFTSFSPGRRRMFSVLQPTVISYVCVGRRSSFPFLFHICETTFTTMDYDRSFSVNLLILVCFSNVL